MSCQQNNWLKWSAYLRSLQSNIWGKKGSYCNQLNNFDCPYILEGYIIKLYPIFVYILASKNVNGFYLTQSTS